MFISGVNIGASAGFKANNDKKSYAPFIGNYCVIGANAVINKNFKESNVTIGRVPGRVITKKCSTGMVIHGA